MSGLRTKKAKRPKLLGLLMLFGLFVLSSSVSGYSGYKDQLPDFGTSFNCETCHLGAGGTLNDFGEDFLANGIEYDDTLGLLDSDGDSYTNDEEFDANPVTNPGDASSYPTGVVVPPDQEEWDWVPWLLTVITGMVLIFGGSVILILIATKNKSKGEKNE